MAICDYCDQEMLDGVSCCEDMVKFENHETLPAIPHHVDITPYDVWLEEWNKAKDDEDTIEEARQRYEKYATGHCHDCGCPNGGYHHPGCDEEKCPRCGGQLIGCGCI